MPAAIRKNPSPRRSNGYYAVVRRAPKNQAWRTRRFIFTVAGVVVFTLVAAQQALDASTNRSGSASDYLTWLLRSDPPHTDNKPSSNPQVEAPQPNSVTVDTPTHHVATGLPTLRTTATGHASSRNMATGRPMPRKAVPGSRAVIERVRNGDTLSSIMQRYGVSLRTSLAMVWAAHQVFDRRESGRLTQKFQAGKLIKLTFDRENHILSLDYPVSKTETLRVFRGESGSFSAELHTTSLGAVERTPSARPAPYTRPDLSSGSIPSAKKRPSSRQAPNTTALSRPRTRQTTTTRNTATSRNTPDYFSGAAQQIHDTVRRGDFLAALLARHGIPQATALQVAKASKPVFDLARMMRPNKKIRLAMDKDGRLMGLAYAMDSDTLLWVTRHDETRFIPHIQKKALETRLKRVTGTIQADGSLFLAGQNAGISQNMVVTLVQLLEWDVDFARDIRAGDQFKVVHEVKYHEGQLERDGEIIAAEFTNQGRHIRVIRYTDPSGKTGYYDAKGRNVRKMFIRAPVDFTRVSSLFSRHRKHPIYGYTRAHKGVDYAAPRGTPVRAAGEGRIAFIGKKGGYGKLIQIRHDTTYTTAYAHLKRFSHGLKVGSRVKQGQVIGQVGTTGASTGPHLHYEVHVNGRQVNPLSAQLPTANPIPARYLQDFRVHSARILAMLEARETQLATLMLDHTSRKR